MNFTLPAAKLWKMVAILLCFDAVLIYTYITVPTVLSAPAPVWDFRIEALRQFENTHPQVVPVNDRPSNSMTSLLHTYFDTDTAATTIQPFWQNLPVEPGLYVTPTPRSGQVR